MAGEARKIVFGARSADRGVVVAEYDKIGLAVDRHLKTPCCLGTVEDEGDPGQRGARGHQRAKIRSSPSIDPHERTKGAVVAHEWVGNRADNPHGAGTKTLVERGFE